VLAEVAGMNVEEEAGEEEEGHRANHPTKPDEVQPDAAAAPPPEPLKTPKKTTYIEIKVVDDETAQPVNWVRLIIKTPDGNENFYTTNAQGLVRIDDLDPGTCDVRCDLKDARLADTLNFIG